MTGTIIEQSLELNKTLKQAKNLKISWGSLPLSPTLSLLVTVAAVPAASYLTHCLLRVLLPPLNFSPQPPNRPPPLPLPQAEFYGGDDNI